jgi:hypothetical protein
VKIIDPDGRFGFLKHGSMVFKATKGKNIGLLHRMQMWYGASIRADICNQGEKQIHMDSYNPLVMIESEIFGCFINTYNNAIRNYENNMKNGEYIDAGVNLHTVADFYSHSNYVELYAEFAQKNDGYSMDLDKIPTFAEAQKDEKLMSFLNGRLKSGIYPADYYPLDETHSYINKDSKNSKRGSKEFVKDYGYSFYEVAIKLAEKETLKIINRKAE